MRIALVGQNDDEIDLIQQTINDERHICVPFAKGHDFLLQHATSPFDLVLIEWLLEDMSGCELVTKFRKKFGFTSLLSFLSHHDAESATVAGLNAGADNYIVKPFRSAEFIARIQAMHDRAISELPQKIFEFGAFRIDVGASEITLRDEVIQLTFREFALALFLFRNAGKMVSRSMIINAVWGRAEQYDSRTLNSHIYRVRTKLRLIPANGVELRTIYAVGYLLRKRSSSNKPTPVLMDSAIRETA